MRLRYVDFNGAHFSGEGHAGVVRDMRDAAWLAVPKGEYMQEVSARVADLTSGRVQVPWNSPKEFLDALVEADFLKPVVKHGDTKRTRRAKQKAQARRFARRLKEIS